MGSLSAPLKVTESWWKNTFLPYLNGTLEDRLDGALLTLHDIVKPGGLLSQKLTVPTNGITEALLSAGVRDKLNAAAGAVLGSAENPVTDPAAARPALPSVWWATGSVTPTNIATGDFRTQAAAVSAGKVVGVAVSGITSTGATVSWDPLPGATSYNLERRVQGATSWAASVGVSSTSVPLSGLNASTAYEVRSTGVVDGVAGTPSDVVTFTTAAAATTIYTMSDGGTGWSAKTNVTVVAGSTEQAKAGTSSLKVTAVAAGNAIAASPPVTTGPNRAVTVSVWVFSTVGRTVQLFVDWQTSTGGYIGQAASSDKFVPANTWTELTLSRTSPATADRAVLYPIVYNAAAGEVHYVDSATVAG